MAETITEQLETLVEIKSNIKSSLEKSRIVWEDTQSMDAGTNFTTYADKIETIINSEATFQEYDYDVNGKEDTVLVPDPGYSGFSTVNIHDPYYDECPTENFTGTVDTAGLRAIGWTTDDINYLQSQVWWNAEDDDHWKVTAENIALYTNAAKTTVDGIEMATKANFSTFKGSQHCRYFPKTDTSTLASNSFTFTSIYLCAVPSFSLGVLTRLYRLFYNCYNLRSVNTSGWNTSAMTSFDNVFTSCYNLRYVDTSNFDTSSATSFNGFFSKCRKIDNIDASNWNTSNVTNMNYVFEGCMLLKTVDVSNWDMSKATTSTNMFQYCYNLGYLDTSKWVLSSVTTVNVMFQNCYKLRHLDVGTWNMGNCKIFSTMFGGCYNVQIDGLSNWNTSSATTMNSMFEYCQQIKTLDLHSWVTSNVTNISKIFYSMIRLTEINVSGWDTSKVTNMSSVFSYAYKLRKLDISNFSTESATNTGYLINECQNLTEIDVSNFNFTSFSSAANTIQFNIGYSIGYDYNSVKSILTALKNGLPTYSTPTAKFTTNSVVVDDEDDTLQNLMDECTTLGWTISNLKIV